MTTSTNSMPGSISLLRDLRCNRARSLTAVERSGPGLVGPLPVVHDPGVAQAIERHSHDSRDWPGVDISLGKLAVQMGRAPSRDLGHGLWSAAHRPLEAI